MHQVPSTLLVMCKMYSQYFPTTQTGTNYVAYLDTIHSTIRSSDCELLVSTTEKHTAKCCVRCVAYRSNLRALVSHHEKQASDSKITDPHSHAMSLI